MALIGGCDDAVVADVETAGHRLGAARIADARSRCIMFGARFAGRDDFRSSSRVRIGRMHRLAMIRAASLIGWPMAKARVPMQARISGTSRGGSHPGSGLAARTIETGRLPRVQLGRCIGAISSRCLRMLAEPPPKVPESVPMAREADAPPAHAFPAAMSR